LEAQVRDAEDERGDSQIAVRLRRFSWLRCSDRNSVPWVLLLRSVNRKATLEPFLRRMERVMALSNQEIVDALKEKSLLETSELVKMIEETFGVSAAAAAVAMPAGGGAAAAGGGEAAAAEEKTEFDVILQAAGGNKINVIKVVREV